MPADLGGCGHYRLILAAEHLKSLGHDIIIQYPVKGNTDVGFDVYFEGDKPVDFRLPVEDVDVIVTQRASHGLHVSAFPFLRSKGIATVVDMDDDLSTIHPQNSAFHIYRHRNIGTPYSYKNAAEICKAATLVTVSTKTLLRVYAGHGRGHVLDNYVPERYLYIQVPPNEKPVFGWTGTVQSHPTDLLACGPAVRDLVKDGHDFLVVGPGHGVSKQFRLTAEPKATGVLSFLDFPSGVAKLDVGIAPLENSVFNASKSRLKPLEYNSLGVPYVVSPRAEYRRWHQESGGCGILAEKPKEWVDGVKTIMRDEGLRRELGEKGRAYVAGGQTIEQNSWRFWEAWTRAHEIQRGISK